MNSTSDPSTAAASDTRTNRPVADRENTSIPTILHLRWLVDFQHGFPLDLFPMERSQVQIAIAIFGARASPRYLFTNEEGPVLAEAKSTPRWKVDGFVRLSSRLAGRAGEAVYPITRHH